MSSSTVSQGLQSCLEPRIVEPRVLRLKLAQPRSNLCNSDPPMNPHIEENKPHEKSTGWSFIQALSTSSSSHNIKIDIDHENDHKVYVHPLAKKHSFSKLDEKSLEMCTESLGSETGSIDNISLLSFDTSSDDYSTKPSKLNKVRASNKPTNGDYSFPPPLTSISGSSGVKVEPHREGGRLVLKAVSVSSYCGSYFHAERGDGRLRIRLMNEYCGFVKFENEGQEEEEEEEVGEEENNGNVGGEMGKEKLNRPSRCKEEGGHASTKGLINWEAFWVTTYRRWIY